MMIIHDFLRNCGCAEVTCTWKSKINFALLSFFRNFAKDFRKSFYK